MGQSDIPYIYSVDVDVFFAKLSSSWLFQSSSAELSSALILIISNPTPTRDRSNVA